MAQMGGKFEIRNSKLETKGKKIRSTKFETRNKEENSKSEIPNKEEEIWYENSEMSRGGV